MVNYVLVGLLVSLILIYAIYDIFIQGQVTNI